MKTKQEMKLTQTEINKTAKQLGDLIFGGLNMWTKAGEMLVEMIDKDPEAINRLCKANKQLTRTMLNRFEQIGRKVYDPRLLLRNCAGYTKARRLPYSAQQDILKNKVKVAVSPGSNDHRLVDVGEMTPQETRIAFTSEGVRTITQQRSFLKAEELRKAKDEKKHNSSQDYVIHNGKVTFRHDVTLDISGIAAILKQMTS